MPNPLFNQLGGGQMTGQMNQFQRFMNSFQEFKASFTGNPQQRVQDALNSGEITQEQFTKAQQMASQIAQMMGG